MDVGREGEGGREGGRKGGRREGGGREERGWEGKRIQFQVYKVILLLLLLLRLFSTETTDTTVISNKDDEKKSALRVCKLKSQQPQLKMYI